MELPDEFVAHFFVAAVQKLRHGGAGDFACISKLRDGHIEMLHEFFQAGYDVHFANSSTKIDVANVKQYFQLCKFNFVNGSATGVANVSQQYTL